MKREVVVDTSVWIDFLNRPDSKSKRAVDRLLDEDVILLCGIVLAELLQGVRSPRERTLLTTHFEALAYVEMTRACWEFAGLLSHRLRSRGVTLPLTDVAIAALALQRGATVLTLDPHFGRVPDLALEPLE